MFVLMIIQTIGVASLAPDKPREAISKPMIGGMVLLRLVLAIWTGVILFS